MQDEYIYGQTPLDLEEKIDLIPSIITREDLNSFEQENILEARIWTMKNSVLAKADIFTENFITLLHKRMYGKVWKWAGKYRKSNKNIGVDFHIIAVELKKLLDDAKYWLDNKVYNIINLAVIFHHRLVKIHLFPNGNGRHARLCADLIVAKYGGNKLTWGNSIKLMQENNFRKQYIAALQEADKGNYSKLLEFAKF